MLVVSHKLQPLAGTRYVSLLSDAFALASFDRLDAAVAYATMSGVNVLYGIPAPLRKVRKRWLVGVDWCRSEPVALDALARMTRSAVRVHDGSTVVARKNCTPDLPFHPKTFIARREDAIAVVTGSGNLSRNGLTRGHETGTLVFVQRPLEAHEQPVWDSCVGVSTWFDGLWGSASDLSGVSAAYRDRFEQRENLESPVPTDDDAVSSPAGRGLTPLQIRKLRASRFLWVEAGNLHKNRGPGRPGNQLMLSPMTRVFFGFPAGTVPTDTLIGHARVEYAGRLRTDCSLRFSNNSMDVLTLPVPAAGVPATYDKQSLLFEKVADKDGVRFVLKLGGAAEKRRWLASSATVSGSYKMTSGRQWGVY